MRVRLGLLLQNIAPSQSLLKHLQAALGANLGVEKRSMTLRMWKQATGTHVLVAIHLSNKLSPSMCCSPLVTQTAREADRLKLAIMAHDWADLLEENLHRGTSVCGLYRSS